MTTHDYSSHLVWHGSTGAGYRAYSREHRAAAPPATLELSLSADSTFRGDERLLNPEQLLVMSVSSCQLLSFLALAARHGIDVVDYEDEATGTMTSDDGPMRFDRIVLAPVVHVAPGTDQALARRLIDEAHAGCYIANSVRATVTIHATVLES